MTFHVVEFVEITIKRGHGQAAARACCRQPGIDQIYTLVAKSEQRIDQLGFLFHPNLRASHDRQGGVGDVHTSVSLRSACGLADFLRLWGLAGSLGGLQSCADRRRRTNDPTSTRVARNRGRVSPRQPLVRVSGDLGAMAGQCHQVLERIDGVEPARVNEAHCGFRSNRTPIPI